MTAWLVLAAGENRIHGGNGGYDDLPSEHYSWDSTVPRHALLKAGDIVVLWNKETLLGASIIDSIQVEDRTNAYFHCPECLGQAFKARATKSPRWRCNSCFHEFDIPAETTKVVTAYQSDHARAWRDLQGLLPGNILRSVCVNPKEQLSLRFLDWDAFVASLEKVSLGTGINQLRRPESEAMLPSGFVQTTIKARIGQAGFRSKLLAMFGENCAVSGPSFHAALEAAHLMQYSVHGVHDLKAGLLLRRDIHSLFDRKLLSVNPVSWCVELSPHIMHVPVYIDLQGSDLKVPRTSKLHAILKAHYEEFQVLARL